MSCLVIGHTRGIGAALVKIFNTEPAHKKVIGCSKSNGFDMTVDTHRRSIIDHAKNCDTVILNAFSDEEKDAQHKMLCDLFRAFENQCKTIVVISSNSADTWKKKMRRYPSYKKLIDHTARQMAHLNTPCRVINIRPGYTATTRISADKHAKAMSPESLALAIRRIIELPSDIRPTEVTLVPEIHHGRNNKNT
tara:strand:- start:81 stop:659 length:579 start_codon:yes stop_codon:yes gene_type:complete